MVRARSKQSNHIWMVHLQHDGDDNLCLMMTMICDDGDDVDYGDAGRASQN